MIDELIVTPLPDGALVQVPPERRDRTVLLPFWRILHRRFPRSWGHGDWTWFVPGPRAARRLALWQAEHRRDVLAARRRARQAAADREWEAATP